MTTEQILQTGYLGLLYSTGCLWRGTMQSQLDCRQDQDTCSFRGQSNCSRDMYYIYIVLINDTVSMYHCLGFFLSPWPTIIFNKPVMRFYLY